MSNAQAELDNVNDGAAFRTPTRPRVQRIPVRPTKKRKIENVEYVYVLGGQEEQPVQRRVNRSLAKELDNASGNRFVLTPENWSAMELLAAVLLYERMMASW